MKKRPPPRTEEDKKRPTKPPDRSHQWETIDARWPEVYQRCVVCFREKPGAYENYNECPGHPDLFQHFSDDPRLIIKEHK